MQVTVPSTGSDFKLLQHFFSRKDVSVICFILAIAIKTLLTFYFQHMGSDKLYQALAGKNLIEGHGLTIKQVHTNNLSKEFYEPLAGWPPGYSFLIALIYLIVNDLDAACFILDVILLILYLIILRKVCNQLAFPAYLTNLTILFYGATIMPYIKSPTDFLTLVLSMYNCSLAIKIFKKENAGFEVVQLAIFNVLPVWFRYVYLPVTFVIPAFIMWNGGLKKDKRLVKYGAFIQLIATAGTAALLKFQIPYVNIPGYVMVSETGIFWSNLLLVHPILVSTFINIDFLVLQLQLLLGLSYSTWVKIMQVISVVVLSVFLFKFLKFSFKKKWVANTSFQTFKMIGGLTSIVIFMAIAFMSLTHNARFPDTPANYSWTYISEGRYFVFLEFVVFIVAAKYLYDNRSQSFLLKKPLQWLILLLLTIEIFHGFYFLKKNFTYDRRNLSHIVNEKPLISYIQNTITEQKKNNTDVVVFGKIFSNRSVLLGGKALLEPGELNGINMHAKKPTLLIAILDTTWSSYFKPFLTKKGVTLQKTIGSLNCFSYYIEAGQ